MKLPDHQEAELAMVDERMARVYRRAFQKLGGKCRFDGARDVEQEKQFVKDGKAWVKDPYASKHVIGPRRLKAEAIDVYPTTPGVNLNKVESYAPVVSAMKEAALEEGVNIAWGFDLWKKDAPHYQLVGG